jgi:hypothetical protein
MVEPCIRQSLTKQPHADAEQEETSFDRIDHKQDSYWYMATTDIPASIIRASCKLMVKGKVFTSIKTNILKGTFRQ